MIWLESVTEFVLAIKVSQKGASYVEFVPAIWVAKLVVQSLEIFMFS